MAVHGNRWLACVNEKNTMYALVTGTEVLEHSDDVIATFELARWRTNGEEALSALAAEALPDRMKRVLERAPEPLRQTGLVRVGACVAFTGAGARTLRRTPELFIGQVVEIASGNGGEASYELVAIRPDRSPFRTCGAEEVTDPSGEM